MSKSGRLTYMKGTPTERFWPKVNCHGPIPEARPELGPCWEYTGQRDRHGYGRFFNGIKKVFAHRWLYEQEHGPQTLPMDHLCRNPPCVRPSHLEPVPQRENVLRGNGFAGKNARKTHCSRGHAFDEANTVIYISPHCVARQCRKCKDINNKARFR